MLVAWHKRDRETKNKLVHFCQVEKKIPKRKRHLKSKRKRVWGEFNIFFNFFKKENDNAKVGKSFKKQL